jgi:hypothetical protein
LRQDFSYIRESDQQLEGWSFLVFGRYIYSNSKRSLVQLF